MVVGPEDQAAFASYWAKNDLPFVGLSDPNHTVLSLYGQEVKLLKLGRMPAQLVIGKEWGRALRALHPLHARHPTQFRALQAARHSGLLTPLGVEPPDLWPCLRPAWTGVGGRIAAQLMHTGRVSHPLNMPSVNWVWSVPPVASLPSAEAFKL